MSWLFVLAVFAMMADVDTMGAAVELVLFDAASGTTTRSIAGSVTVSVFVIDQLFDQSLEGSLLLYRGSLLLYKHDLEIVGATKGGICCCCGSVIPWDTEAQMNTDKYRRARVRVTCEVEQQEMQDERCTD